MGKKSIGVDIGVTKIQVGVVQGAEVTRELKFPTLVGSSKENIIQIS